MMVLYDTKYNLTQDNDIKVKNKNVTHYILICFIAILSVVMLQIILQNVMVQIVNLQNVVGPVL